MAQQKWITDDDGYIFAGVVHGDEPDVENYDDLVSYMDGMVAEANSNPERIIGKLTSLLYELGKDYFDRVGELEYKLEQLNGAYTHHEHVNAVIVKD